MPILLEWPALDALYEVGCGDATIGHDLLEFTWSAASRGQTLRPALRDVELVAGVSVERIEFGEGSAGPVRRSLVKCGRQAA